MMAELKNHPRKLEGFMFLRPNGRCSLSESLYSILKSYNPIKGPTNPQAHKHSNLVQ